MNAVVAHVSQSQRGLVSHRLLHPEAPLLPVRSVEGPDLVMNGRGAELGSQ